MCRFSVALRVKPIVRLSYRRRWGAGGARIGLALRSARWRIPRGCTLNTDVRVDLELLQVLPRADATQFRVGRNVPLEASGLSGVEELIQQPGGAALLAAAPVSGRAHTARPIG